MGVLSPGHGQQQTQHVALRLTAVEETGVHDTGQRVALQHV